MNFDYTPEQAAVRDMVRRFAAEEIAPLVADAEENEAIPRALFRRFGELGSRDPFTEKAL